MRTIPLFYLPKPILISLLNSMPFYTKITFDESSAGPGISHLLCIEED